MMPADLALAAERAGISRNYWDAWGVSRMVPDRTLERLLAALQAPSAETRESGMAPPLGNQAACHRPSWMAEGARLWGISVQLYGIRSERNWGIGDFTDLKRVIECAAEAGADFVATNPLHALFAADRRHISPYSPSSREFLNVLYIDATAMRAYARAAAARKRVGSREFRAALDDLRGSEVVDYVAVADRKDRVFRAVFRDFERRCAAEPDHPGSAELDHFIRDRGEALRRFAVYQALSSLAGFGPDWRQWPAEYRNPDGAAAAEFAERKAREVRYHQYLQWEADLQLESCAQAARATGMKVGLCLDLAVGASLASAEGWAEQDKIIQGFHIGAPPDAWNENGQDWGLAAYNPFGMARDGFAAFRRLLRANMRRSGALRVDHVLGLNRLFLVPEAGKPADGAYLRFPLGELCAALAAESVDNRCVVVGEDLGTVPEGLRQLLGASGILSYRLLMFGTDDQGRYVPPQDYPRDALVAFSTHDLPTLRGYWAAADVSMKAALGLYPGASGQDAILAQREADRRGLIAAFEQAGLAAGASVSEVHAAAYRFLAQTPCWLFQVQMEDLAFEAAQPNLPGTSDEYPNWRRKLSRNFEDIFADPEVDNLLAGVRAARPRGATS